MKTIHSEYPGVGACRSQGRPPTHRDALVLPMQCSPCALCLASFLLVLGEAAGAPLAGPKVGSSKLLELCLRCSSRLCRREGAGEAAGLAGCDRRLGACAQHHTITPRVT